MNTKENMIENIAVEFIISFIKRNGLDLTNEEDLDKLRSSVDGNNPQLISEYLIYLNEFARKNNVEPKDYIELHDLVLNEEVVEKVIKFEQKRIKDLGIIRDVMFTKLNIAKLGSEEVNEIYNAIDSESITEFRTRLNNHLKDINLSNEDLEELKDELLFKMREMKKNFTKKEDDLDLKSLVVEFLERYKEHFDLDVTIKKDREEFKSAIDTLEAQEIETFFKEKNINILNYPEFRKIAMEEVSNFIDSRLFSSVMNDVIVYFDLSHLSDLEAKSLYEEINQSSLNNFANKVSSVIEGKNINDNMLKEIRNQLLIELCVQYPNITMNTNMTPSAYTKFIQELLNEVPKDSINAENYNSIFTKMLEKLEIYFQKNNWNQNMIIEMLNIFKDEFNQKFNNSKNLNYYEKLVEVFNTFDYDHLSKEEKEELIAKIGSGEFLTEEVKNRLGITDIEYEKMQQDLLAKLISSRDIIFERYINALKAADESYFEELQKHLTVEEIRENHNEAQNMSNEEIEALITEIQKAAVDITLDKILKNPEVDKFITEFYDEVNKTSIEEFDKLGKILDDFQESKEMLGLTEFNKILLITKLRKELEAIKLNETKIYGVVSQWDEKIKSMKAEELMPFYTSIDDMTKEDLGFEEIEEEELKIVKDRLKDFVLDEIAIRILNDLNMDKVDNLDELKTKIDNLKSEDFAPYNVPEELQETIKNIAKNKIEEEKELRRQEKTDKYLKIGTEVVLTKEVSMYQNGKEFMKNNTLNDEKIKKNKKGIIDGYIVKKDDEVLELTATVDLEKCLKNGYELVGYKFNFKNFFSPSYTYVKLDEVAAKEKLSLKEMLDQKWKKVLFAAGVTAGVIAAFFGIPKLFGGNATNDNSKTNTQIEADVVAGMQNNTEDLKNAIEEVKNETKQNHIYIDNDRIELDKEIAEVLNSMPGTKCTYNITKDAQIFESMDQIAEGKGSTSYHNSHNDYDLERRADAWIIRDSEGNQKLYHDINEAADLIVNHDATYVGARTLNKYSTHDKDYEGFFVGDDIVIEDGMQSVLDQLQNPGKSRRLTK